VTGYLADPKADLRKLRAFFTNGVSEKAALYTGVPSKNACT
jgi:hypothetical protein